jgi:transcriptional regulator with XRE-family HTH domain
MRVGLTEGAIRQIESGQTKSASLANGLRIAHVLNVSPWALLGEEEPERLEILEVTAPKPSAEELRRFQWLFTRGLGIKRARLQANFEIEDVAEELRVPQTTVKNWESGTESPDLYSLHQLADAFDFSVDELLFGQDSARRRWYRRFEDEFTATHRALGKAIAADDAPMPPADPVADETGSHSSAADQKLLRSVEELTTAVDEILKWQNRHEPLLESLQKLKAASPRRTRATGTE